MIVYKMIHFAVSTKKCLRLLCDRHSVVRLHRFLSHDRRCGSSNRFHFCSRSSVKQQTILLQTENSLGTFLKWRISVNESVILRAYASSTKPYGEIPTNRVSETMLSSRVAGERG